MDQALTRRLSALVLVAALAVGSGGVSAVGPTPATLTEIEQLRRQVVALQRELAHALDERDAIRKNRDDLIVQIETARLKADLERNHPGYVFNAATGALELQPATAPTEKP